MSFSKVLSSWFYHGTNTAGEEEPLKGFSIPALSVGRSSLTPIETITYKFGKRDDTVVHTVRLVGASTSTVTVSAFPTLRS